MILVCIGCMGSTWNNRIQHKLTSNSWFNTIHLFNLHLKRVYRYCYKVCEGNSAIFKHKKNTAHVIIPSRDSRCSNMLLQDLISEDFWHRTAVCFDDGQRKVCVTYSYLLQSSSELTGGLRKCVGGNKVCCTLCLEVGLVFIIAHVTVKYNNRSKC